MGLADGFWALVDTGGFADALTAELAAWSPAELVRSLRAIAALYSDGLDVWAARTGRPRPEHPLATPVIQRLETLEV